MSNKIPSWFVAAFVVAVFVGLMITVVFLLSSCTPTPVDPHPTPVVQDTELCDAAEANLKQLNCKEAQPTARGERFGDVCRELQNDGIFINPKCLASVTDCSQVDVCTGTRAK